MAVWKVNFPPGSFRPYADTIAIGGGADWRPSPQAKINQGAGAFWAIKMNVRNHIRRR